MKFLKEAIETGDCCPNCCSRVTESMNMPVIEANEVTLPVSCVDCEAEWVEHFRLYQVEVIDDKNSTNEQLQQSEQSLHNETEGQPESAPLPTVD